MKTRQVCKHLVPGARLSLHASSCTRSVVCTGAHGEETHGEAASSIERTHLIHSFRKKKEKEKKKDTLGTSSASIVPGRRNAHERSRNLARCMECIYVQGGRPSTNRVASS